MQGLYFLGLTWQHTRGSALIGWVKEDAEFIAAKIAEKAETGFGDETSEDEIVRAPLAAGVAQEV